METETPVYELAVEVIRWRTSKVRSLCLKEQIGKELRKRGHIHVPSPGRRLQGNSLLQGTGGILSTRGR